MRVDGYQALLDALQRTSQIGYPSHSRIHPLRTFPDKTFVKRDDELGFGITGTKVRKFRTLIPYLLQENVVSAAVIGGAHSNNVLGLSQLLIENGIAPTLFLRGSPAVDPIGNELLIRLLVGPQNIQWIARARWSEAESLAHAWASQNIGKKSIVIPEGSNLPASLPGATTLALDIIHNERESGVIFDHLFIDVGTGLSAIAAMLGIAAIQKAVNVHLVLLAGSEQQFRENLVRYHGIFEKWIRMPIQIPENFTLHYPPTARSFGSINAEVTHMIHTLAQKEGFLTDPVYSAKLFMTAKSVIEKEHLKGNILIVHSGGGMTLPGFSTHFNRSL